MSFKKILAIAALPFIFLSPVHAQEVSHMNKNPVINIPADFVQKEQRYVKADGENVVLTRYVRSDGRNAEIEGEHFSTVYTPAGKLKGFVNITYDLVGKPLPSKEKAQEIAQKFLRTYAPDLIDGLELHWIDKHDEPICIQHAGKTEKVTLTGMKVKMRNKRDGLWFWVIVGADEEVMVFERDIYWISFPGKRRTEKWLHDSFLKKNL